MTEILDTYGALLLRAIGVHLMYVAVASLAGLVLGLALGVAFSRFPAAARVLLPIISVLQTIPGLVFIGLLFLVLGMVPATVLIALSIYAMFPVLKNTYTGLLAVDARTLEAAKGCGMSPWQSLVRVEIPLALPSILAGFRMSVIYTVSWAVLAAMIGLGGLGDFIYQGTSSNNNTLILVGAVPAAVLAITLGRIIDVLGRRLTPRGMRKGAGR